MQIALQAPEVFGVADLEPDEILSKCSGLGVTAVELAASAIENYLGKPSIARWSLEMPDDAFETGALPLEQEILQDELALARQTIDERVHEWRANASLAPLDALRQRAADAGVRIAIVWWPGLARLSDPDVDWCFMVAKTLGVPVLAMPLVVGDPRRLAPFADRHAMTVAFRGDGATRPSDVAAALKQSPWHAVSLDLRAWVSGGHRSPVPFLRQHAGRVIQLRIDATDVVAGPIADIVGEVLTEARAHAWAPLVTIGLSEDTLPAGDRLESIGRALDVIGSRPLPQE